MFKKLLRIFSSAPALQPVENTKATALGSEKVTASSAREMLKEATALKREKKLMEACDKLRSAFDAYPNEITLNDCLRLPSYLLLAGRNDEAWRELNLLVSKYPDFGSMSAIHIKMSAQLFKEGKYEEALIHRSYSICCEVLRLKIFCKECEDQADQEAKCNDELTLMLREGRDVTGTTKAGNPITDCSYPWMQRSLEGRLSSESIEKDLIKFLKKTGGTVDTTSYLSRFVKYVQSGGMYDLRHIQLIHQEHKL